MEFCTWEPSRNMTPELLRLVLFPCLSKIIKYQHQNEHVIQYNLNIIHSTVNVLFWEFLDLTIMH